MISFIGLLSLIGGVAVLVGAIFPTLVNYPLIYIGAGLAIFAGIVDIFKKKHKF